MANTIIIRPIFTEKTQLIGKDNRYAFIVDKEASKHQIRTAVEELFSVQVVDVNTTRMPAKLKTRFTKSGIQRGRRPAYKKAYVTLKQDNSIDFFGDVATE